MGGVASTAGLMLLTSQLLGCMSHAAFETGRVQPAGRKQITGGSGVVLAPGNRHRYQLEDASGDRADAGRQHLPFAPAGIDLVGRVACGLGHRLELQGGLANPLLHPFGFGLGGSLGLRAQVLGGRHGVFAAALGARAAGHVSYLGAGSAQEEATRRWLLGQLEARATLSYHPWERGALYLVPTILREEVRDRLSKSESTFSAGSGRTLYGLSAGAALGSERAWLAELGVLFAPRREGQRGHGRFFLGLARSVSFE